MKVLVWRRGERPFRRCPGSLEGPRPGSPRRRHDRGRCPIASPTTTTSSRPGGAGASRTAPSVPAFASQTPAADAPSPPAPARRSARSRPGKSGRCSPGSASRRRCRASAHWGCRASPAACWSRHRPDRTRRRSEQNHAGAEAVGELGGGEAGAAIVEHAQDVAVGDAAGSGILGRDRARLVPVTLLGVAAGCGRAGSEAVSAGWSESRCSGNRSAASLPATRGARSQIGWPGQSSYPKEAICSEKSSILPDGVFSRFVSGSGRNAASITGSRLSPVASARPASQNAAKPGSVTPRSLAASPRASKSGPYPGASRA